MAESNSNRRNSRFIDLTGQRFGKWTVIDEAIGHKPPLTYWNVVCDCGHRTAVPGTAMRRGRSSCCTSCRITTHGKSRSPEYTVWRGMKQRCNNPLHESRSDYSERGITVCDEWDSFDVFYADMGKRPSPKHTLERKNNNLGYFAANCKWATRSEQLRNTRRNRLIIFNNKTMCLTDWASEVGIPFTTLRARLKYGWSIERALTEPVKEKS